MFQIRGLSDDAWAHTQPDQPDTQPDQPDLMPVITDIGSKIKSIFSSTPTVDAPKPWYKTPIGIAALLAGAFVGWKYVLPKLRK